MRIENDVKLDFKDVLLRPKRSTISSRKEVSLIREYRFKYSTHPYKGVPIMAANMDGVGTRLMANTFYSIQSDLSVCLRKHYTVEELSQFFDADKHPESNNCWYSMGIGQHDLDKFEQVRNRVGKLRICLDVANGYNEKFLDTVKILREKYPDNTIMAGNVVTGDMTEALILAGADMVKVGIGGGSVCTTRKMTGVGYPQLSAVIECADAAHGLGGLICSDGGCQVPGDIVKAFGGGADFVMLGGMLSGYAEGEYNLIEGLDGKSYYQFYGMSSDTAQLEHEGTIRKYRASEGRTIQLVPKGSIEPTIQEILGGVRSAMTYIGAANLKEISKRTTFIRVTQQLNPMFDS